MALAAGRSAAGALSRVAQRGDAAADDGGDGEAAVSSVSSRAGRPSRRWPRRATPRSSPNGRGSAIMRGRATSSPAPARSRERGGISNSAAELRKLPGIGAYTSAAIAAIAFGEKARRGRHQRRARDRPPSRLAEPDRGEIERRAARNGWPSSGPGDFVQALMDLGATICRPRQPRCAECPLERGLRRLCERRAGRLSGAARAQGHARIATARLLDRARRPGLAGAPPAQGPARRNGRASRQRVDRHAAAGSRAARHRPPRLHPFLARPRASSFAPSPSAKAGGIRSTALGEAGLPTLYRRAAELALASAPQAPRRRLKKPELPLKRRANLPPSSPH